ncbi:MAG TPA: hypothetical protein VE981_20645 [Planctomycetota bacterium]|nr:hypothetical protein [Planctomycetota bacterium]
MNSLVEILACPLCKMGMDELQARAMEYSIYLMLGMIYSLMGIIGFKVVRMMTREEREMKQKEAAAAKAVAKAPVEETVSSR